MYMSSASPLISNQTLMLRGLAAEVLSLSHLLKKSIYIKAFTMFQEIPVTSLVEYFGLV